MKKNFALVSALYLLLVSSLSPIVQAQRLPDIETPAPAPLSEPEPVPTDNSGSESILIQTAQEGVVDLSDPSVGVVVSSRDGEIDIGIINPIPSEAPTEPVPSAEIAEQQPVVVQPNVEPSTSQPEVIVNPGTNEEPISIIEVPIDPEKNEPTQAEQLPDQPIVTTSPEVDTPTPNIINPRVTDAPPDIIQTPTIPVPTEEPQPIPIIDPIIDVISDIFNLPGGDSEPTPQIESSPEGSTVVSTPIEEDVEPTQPPLVRVTPTPFPEPTQESPSIFDPIIDIIDDLFGDNSTSEPVSTDLEPVLNDPGDGVSDVPIEPERIEPTRVEQQGQPEATTSPEVDLSAPQTIVTPENTVVVQEQPELVEPTQPPLVRVTPTPFPEPTQESPSIFDPIIDIIEDIFGGDSTTVEPEQSTSQPEVIVNPGTSEDPILVTEIPVEPERIEPTQVEQQQSVPGLTASPEINTPTPNIINPRVTEATPETIQTPTIPVPTEEPQPIPIIDSIIDIIEDIFGGDSTTVEPAPTETETAPREPGQVVTGPSPAESAPVEPQTQQPQANPTFSPSESNPTPLPPQEPFLPTSVPVQPQPEYVWVTPTPIPDPIPIVGPLVESTIDFFDGESATSNLTPVQEEILANNPVSEKPNEVQELFVRSSDLISPNIAEALGLAASSSTQTQLPESSEAIVEKYLANYQLKVAADNDGNVVIQRGDASVKSPVPIVINPQNRSFSVLTEQGIIPVTYYPDTVKDELELNKIINEDLDMTLGIKGNDLVYVATGCESEFMLAFLPVCPQKEIILSARDMSIYNVRQSTISRVVDLFSI